MEKLVAVGELTSALCAQLASLDGLFSIEVGRDAGDLKTLNEATAALLWGAPASDLRTILRAPKLRWIHSRSAGVEQYVIPELLKSEAVLTNGRGVFADALAEFALFGMLFFSRNYPRMEMQRRKREWVEFPPESLADRRLLIVGYGAIGRAIAKRANCFGMKITGVRRAPAAADEYAENVVTPERLLEECKTADYVALSAALTSETRRIIGARELAAMKPSAVIINVGRGALIDEGALITALRGKKIQGAALDVVEDEPLSSNSPLYELPNVILSPHCADQVEGWLSDAMEMFLSNAKAFAERKPLQNIVEKSRGY